MAHGVINAPASSIQNITVLCLALLLSSGSLGSLVGQQTSQEAAIVEEDWPTVLLSTRDSACAIPCNPEANWPAKVKVVRDHRPVIDWVEARVEPSLAETLQASGQVERAQEGFTYHASAEATKIGAPLIWNGTAGTAATGKGVEIAVIDSGIDYLHADLGGCLGSGCKVAGGYDFWSHDADPMDDYGHGTHVAAIAAGNGTLQGIAPDATLYGYKIGGGGWISYLAIINALVRATDPNSDGDTSDRHDIILMALGCRADSCGTVKAFREAVDAAVASGATVIGAAGNGGLFLGDISIPGAWPGVIAVGATTLQDEMGGGSDAYFSALGPAAQKGYTQFKPDVVAPGVEVCAARASVVATGSSFQCHDADHIAVSGTSMASAVVAGAAALLLEQNPTQTSQDLRARLRASAVDTSVANPILQGAGRVDVAGAAVTSFFTTAPQPTLHSSIDPRFHVEVEGSGPIAWTLERAYCSCFNSWDPDLDPWQTVATGNLTAPGTFEHELTPDRYGVFQIFRVRFTDSNGVEAEEYTIRIHRAYAENTGWYPLQTALASGDSWNHASGAASWSDMPAWTANFDPTSRVEWIQFHHSFDGGQNWIAGYRNNLETYVDHHWQSYGTTLSSSQRTLADLQSPDFMLRIEASTGATQDLRGVHIPGDPTTPIDRIEANVRIRLEDYAMGWREPLVVDVDESVDTNAFVVEAERAKDTAHAELCASVPGLCTLVDPFEEADEVVDNAAHTCTLALPACNVSQASQYAQQLVAQVTVPAQQLCQRILRVNCEGNLPPPFPSDPCNFLSNGCPDVCGALDGGCPDPCPFVDGCPEPQISEIDPNNPPAGVGVDVYESEPQPWWRLEMAGATVQALIPNQPTNAVSYNFDTKQITNVTTCINQCRAVAVDASGAAPIFALRGYALSDPYPGNSFRGNHEIVSIVNCLDANCDQTTSRVLDGNAPCPTGCHHKWNTGHGVQIQRTSDNKVVLAYSGNQHFDGTFSLFVTACEDADCSGNIDYRIVAGARRGCPTDCDSEQQLAFYPSLDVSPAGDTVLTYLYDSPLGLEHDGLAFIRCHTPDCMGDMTRTILVGADCTPIGCEDVGQRTFRRSDVHWNNGLPVIIMYPNMELIGDGWARFFPEPLMIHCGDRDCTTAEYQTLTSWGAHETGRFGYNPNGPSTFGFSQQGSTNDAAQLGRCLSQFCTDPQWPVFGDGGEDFDGRFNCPLGCDPWADTHMNPAASYVGYDDNGLPWVLFSTVNSHDLRFVQCGTDACGPSNSYQHVDGHAECVSTGCDPRRAIYSFDVDRNANGRIHITYADSNGAYMTRKG